MSLVRKKVCPRCQQTVVPPCPTCRPKIEEEKKEQAAFAEKVNERKRGSASARGYNYRWQKVRETWLKRAANRWCFYCQQKHKPRLTPATIIDHFIPHRGDQALFWDKSNWRPACKPCHDRKTGRGQ